jgi:hypothetical protein
MIDMNPNPKLMPLLSLLLLAVVLGGATAWSAEKKAKSPIAGHWKWTFTMPDGSTIEPRLKLHHDGEAVTGTSLFRRGHATPIREGVFRDGEVSFQVVRERDGHSVTTRYRGKLDGDTIKGAIESDWAGEARRYEWVAQRVPDTANGTWLWTTRLGGRDVEIKLKLKQDGAKLAGKISGRGRGELDIKEGKLTDGEVSFEVSWERDGNRYWSRHSGTLDGDTITGKVEYDWAGDPGTRDWEAKRVSEGK